jgi:hypothetical protein
MFEEERNAFKEEFFDELFDPYAPVDYSQRTTLLINAILEEENLPFIFTIGFEDDKWGDKDKKYWLLKEL